MVNKSQVNFRKILDRDRLFQSDLIPDSSQGAQPIAVSHSGRVFSDWTGTEWEIIWIGSVQNVQVIGRKMHSRIE